MTEGKIVKSLSGFYYVLSENGIVYQCRARGNFRKRKITPLVGDDVEFEAENLTDGYVLNILPRKNVLVRPPIANVDQALVVFSVKEPDLNLQLLDKFLVHIEANRIEPVICFTKIDLLGEHETKNMDSVAEIYQSIGYHVLFLSMKDKKTNDKITPYLKEKITVVAGQSGVGKSSLLNLLNPSLKIETNSISSHLGRGKHTTRHVELFSVAGGLVADTPGFSSLAFSHFTKEELSDTFIEISKAGEYCKFRGCTHLAEPGCAVKQAVEDGDIAKSRYSHYEAFFKEIKETKRRY
ncbi:ribosome small subunit-dependent GTPase A [Pueribacillus theae]|uniref:Small ribosomal subunit biogenesis GTPase RsgA n=1 Tax=Pueribacillus theae TaxID=2171751 RepID=A0A2U1K7U1_9BACI|nr:ribosome small subunit-dependent GTPase A [Pueribacillus theae]PWA13587.1 ribosome small subunit-dependent GTPase A [Pueribacillus theae]